MKKTLTASLAAATIAVTLAASATTASAQRGVAAGVAAGLVGGLIIGSAIANSPAYGGPAIVVAPAPGFVVYSGYHAALPGPRCYWTRRPVYDGFGNVVGWRGRPVAVCP
jgi:hypothetical protein